MTRYQVEIRITPRPGLLDPEGKAIHHALRSLGYDAVADARVGKAIHLEVNARSGDEARALAEEVCRKLLANPVTEDFRVESVGDGSSAGGGGAGAAVSGGGPAAAGGPSS